MSRFEILIIALHQVFYMQTIVKSSWNEKYHKSYVCDALKCVLKVWFKISLRHLSPEDQNKKINSFVTLIKKCITVIAPSLFKWVVGLMEVHICWKASLKDFADMMNLQVFLAANFLLKATLHIQQHANTSTNILFTSFISRLFLGRKHFFIYAHTNTADTHTHNAHS